MTSPLDGTSLIGEAYEVAFIAGLIWQVPALIPTLAEHLEDNQGEVIPHVLMSRVEKATEKLLATDRSSVLKILEYLDAGATCEVQCVVDMVDVSFVEHLPFQGEEAAELRTMLRGRLIAMLKH